MNHEERITALAIEMHDREIYGESMKEALTLFAYENLCYNEEQADEEQAEELYTLFCDSYIGDYSEVGDYFVELANDTIPGLRDSNLSIYFDYKRFEEDALLDYTLLTSESSGKTYLFYL